MREGDWLPRSMGPGALRLAAAMCFIRAPMPLPMDDADELSGAAPVMIPSGANM